MASKPVYKEGELSATRSRLGSMNNDEAKHMMKVLGGEVGEERSAAPEPSKSRKTVTPKKPMRRVETAVMGSEESLSESKPHLKVELPSFSERVKMDRLSSEADFRIKTKFQALCSRFAFFGPQPDYVAPVFVTAKIDQYYSKIEQLVNHVRYILPRNNTDRSSRFKKHYPFSFSVLDALRYWKIEKIASSLSRLQTHPRYVLVRECDEIVREFYRPLFILELLEPDVHITKAVEDLDKMLKNDSTNPVKEKETAQKIVFLYDEIDKDIRYRLYPLLMKLTSNICYSYEDFFTDCRGKIFTFLGMEQNDRIEPVTVVSMEDIDDEVSAEETGNEPPHVDIGEQLGIEKNEAPEEEKKQPVLGAKPKAVQKGLETLELLFPAAGWKSIDRFPDMYHYFSKTLSLKRNSDLIAPENPMVQALILLQILEELFYGFRSISFNGAGFELNLFLDIIDSWHRLIESSFERMYLPRIAEFQKLFDNALEGKTKPYAMKLREELNWITRLYLFPMLPVESFAPPPFKKNDVDAVFPKVRTLRSCFTTIAGEIERALNAGGAESDARCAAINNPWDSYVFQVPNPLSKRLDMLLGKNNKNNVSLIFFTLSVLTVLDYLLNNENSWAYQTNTNKIFRSLDEDGLKPAPLPDININADAIFKDAIDRLRPAEAKG